MFTSIEASPAAGQAAPLAVISEDWASPRPAPAPPRKPAPAAPAVELTDQRIKEAVAATIAAAPDKDSVPANRQGLRAPTLSADEYKKLSEGFANAKVPACLGPDGLKLQPPKIGAIGFGGLLALPFLLVAAARGKCK